MDAFLNQNTANDLQPISILLGIMGFLLTAIEIYFPNAKDWIQNHILNFMFTEITFTSLYRKNIFRIYIETLLFSCFQSIFLLIFGIIDFVGVVVLLSIGVPCLCIISIIGASQLISLKQVIPADHKIRAFFFCFIVMLPISYVLTAKLSQKMFIHIIFAAMGSILMCILSTATTGIYFLTAKSISLILNILAKRTDDKALGGFGLLLSLVGLIIALYQSTVLWFF